MKRPNPTTESMNRNRLAARTKNEPAKGIRKQPMATAVIRNPSAKPMIMAGMVLPASISRGDSGVTRSWS
jgi:hypothetical protein